MPDQITINECVSVAVQFMDQNMNFKPVTEDNPLGEWDIVAIASHGNHQEDRSQMIKTPVPAAYLAQVIEADGRTHHWIPGNNMGSNYYLVIIGEEFGDLGFYLRPELGKEAPKYHNHTGSIKGPQYRAQIKGTIYEGCINELMGGVNDQKARLERSINLQKKGGCLQESCQQISPYHRINAKWVPFKNATHSATKNHLYSGKHPFPLRLQPKTNRSTIHFFTRLMISSKNTSRKRQFTFRKRFLQFFT